METQHLTPARRFLALVGFAFVGAIAGHAVAKRPHRHPFEPTDLELDDPGTLDIDHQTGWVHGEGDSGNRLVLSDFELDLGLRNDVELDLDGAFGFDNYGTSAQRLTGEPLWTAMKLGFGDDHDDGGTSFAWGMQLGPRIPTLNSGRGIGYEALVLVGISQRRAHWVANLGGFIDPGAEIGSGRPTAALGGLDLDLDLDERNTFSLLGELGAGYYLSSDPHDLHATAGIDWSPAKWLDLSLVGFAGFLPNGDRLGAFLGASPKLALF